MMSKWMDAATHASVYHMQCDHYNQIKPPSFYEYEELNHLNMTRDRERGVDYTAFDFGDEDDDSDLGARRYSSPRGLRNRRRKKSYTEKAKHNKNSNYTAPTVRSANGSGSLSSDGFPYTSAHGAPGTPMPETPATVQPHSPDYFNEYGHGSDNRHHSDSDDGGRVSSFGNHSNSSAHCTRSERERKQAQKRQRELRSIVKSINYLQNEKKQEKANRISTAYRQTASDLSLPQAMGSGDSSHFPGAISEDEHDLEESASFFADQLGNSERHSGGSPVTLWGRPRLDGNWGTYFTYDTKNPFATFYDPFHADHVDASGFASMKGGHTPPLFLQELAHLASLLMAVALSTLRNDIEGAESPLSVYVPGKPWPEVDPD
jgi:hypothetical protein